MKLARCFLALLIATIALSTTTEAADNAITLANGLLEVKLVGDGLKSIHDKKSGKTVSLAQDDFSLVVDGQSIDSSKLTATVKKENDSTVTNC